MFNRALARAAVTHRGIPLTRYTPVSAHTPLRVKPRAALISLFLVAVFVSLFTFTPPVKAAAETCPNEEFRTGRVGELARLSCV